MKYKKDAVDSSNVADFVHMPFFGGDILGAARLECSMKQVDRGRMSGVLCVIREMEANNLQGQIKFIETFKANYIYDGSDENKPANVMVDMCLATLKGNGRYILNTIDIGGLL